VRRILRLLARVPPRRIVVAAVPVRTGPAGGLEFLLVRTSDGERWTFPKGGVEGGETLAEAAAREAVEEAGVAGRLGDEPIGEYRYGENTVTAFLLEVEHAERPQEPGRDPTWCGLEAARSRLAAGRRGGGGFGEEMERILLAAQRVALK